MEFRSKSCRDQTLRSMQDLRCYSANYAGSSACSPNIGKGKEMKMKKGKVNFGKSSKSWSLSDPKLQRKKRIAGYKVYAVKGKMKGSLRKGFNWINTYTQAVYGWW